MRTTLQLAVVALTTFALTRWIDTVVRSGQEHTSPAATELELLRRTQALRHPAEVPAAVPTGPVPVPVAAAAEPFSRPAITPVPAGSLPRPQPVPPKAPYFIVIGFPIGIDKRNYDRRQLLRAMWYPEYPNLGKTVRSEFVVGLLTYQGDGHAAAILDQMHEEHDAYGDMAFVNAREATRDPYRGNPKCTGEKIVAWFQQVVVAHRGTQFFCKADWDTWIHTTRLEVNLRLLAQRNEPTYFGNTLWCSYSVGDFQPCGYGFGPLQAAGARHTECSMLPHGKDDAVGPFPYAAGLFWGLSYDIVRWMAGSRLVYDFVHNASARFEPPYWVKGEDSAFGFFLHISPFKKVTPIHWGWNVVHDGYEFRSAKERGLCTQHVSDSSLVVHSMHTVPDFELVRSQLRERCNASCEQARLPFEVDGLADLCGRNPRIRNVYAKCEHAGFPPNGKTDLRTFDLTPAPRPRCRSMGANVPFIAHKDQGGTITCDEERDVDWDFALADRRGGGAGF